MNKVSFKRKKSFDVEDPQLFTVEWANGLLKFGIGVLRGDHGWKRKANFKYRLILARDVQDNLLRNKFTWQAKILGHWIHKAMKDLAREGTHAEARSSSPEEREEDSS